jgi:hypothetical protein
MGNRATSNLASNIHLSLHSEERETFDSFFSVLSLRGVAYDL